jgi:hypothetical protein
MLKERRVRVLSNEIALETDVACEHPRLISREIGSPVMNGRVEDRRYRPIRFGSFRNQILGKLLILLSLGKMLIATWHPMSPRRRNNRSNAAEPTD